MNYNWILTKSAPRNLSFQNITKTILVKCNQQLVSQGMSIKITLLSSRCTTLISRFNKTSSTFNLISKLQQTIYKLSQPLFFYKFTHIHQLSHVINSDNIQKQHKSLVTQENGIKLAYLKFYRTEKSSLNLNRQL